MAKTCPHRPQVFKKLNKDQAFPQAFFFQVFSRYSKARMQSFSGKCSKIWLCKAHVRSYLTPKVDPILKLSNYKATTPITHVFWTKVQMLTPFLGDKTLKFGTRVLWAPTQPLTKLFFFFSPLFHRPRKKCHFADFLHKSTTGSTSTRLLCLFLVRHSVALPQLQLHLWSRNAPPGDGLLGALTTAVWQSDSSFRAL